MRESLPVERRGEVAFASISRGKDSGIVQFER